MSVCNDLITILTSIRDELAALDVTQGNVLVQVTAQASAQSQLNTEMRQLTQASAIATAWSQSISASWATALIENTVEIEINDLDEATPPPPELIAPSGISDTPVDSDFHCARASYAVDFWIQFWSHYRLFYSTMSGFSAGVVQGLIGGLLTLVSRQLGGSPQILAAAVVAQIAMEILELIYSDFPQAVIEAIDDWLNDNREGLICLLYNAASSAKSLVEMQGDLDVYLSANPIIGASNQLIKLFFNRSTLATIYYDPSGGWIAPAYDPDDCNPCNP